MSGPVGLLGPTGSDCVCLARRRPLVASALAKPLLQFVLGCHWAHNDALVGSVGIQWLVQDCWLHPEPIVSKDCGGSMDLCCGVPLGLLSMAVLLLPGVALPWIVVPQALWWFQTQGHLASLIEADILMLPLCSVAIVITAKGPACFKCRFACKCVPACFG